MRRYLAPMLALGIFSASLFSGSAYASSSPTPVPASSLVGKTQVVDTDTTFIDGAKFETTLKITFDRPLTAQQAAEAAADMGEREKASTAATTNSMTTMAAPNGTVIVCNRLYSFADSNGTYTLQRACGGTTAPWGWKMSAANQATVNGTLNEAGMNWTKNGVRQGNHAAHPAVYPGYQFHGNYNPVKAGDSVTYSDLVTYRHNIGPGGNAELYIRGSWKLGSDYL